jgi:hypothetical protein
MVKGGPEILPPCGLRPAPCARRYRLLERGEPWCRPLWDGSPIDSRNVPIPCWRGLGRCPYTLLATGSRFRTAYHRARKLNCPNYDLTRTLELATENNATYQKFKIRLAMIFVVTVLAQPQGAAGVFFFPFGLPIPVFYGPAYYPSCCYGPYGYAH